MNAKKQNHFSFMVSWLHMLKTAEQIRTATDGLEN